MVCREVTQKRQIVDAAQCANLIIINIQPCQLGACSKGRKRSQRVVGYIQLLQLIQTAQRIQTGQRVVLQIKVLELHHSCDRLQISDGVVGKIQRDETLSILQTGDGG